MKKNGIQQHSDRAPAHSVNQHTYTPKADIFETAEEYILEAEMPGVDKDNVDVKLEDGVLNVIGRVQPTPLTGYKKIYSEYEIGNFERAFELTDQIDVDKVRATMKDGVLHLTLPKRESIKPKRIEVKVG